MQITICNNCPLFTVNDKCQLLCCMLNYTIKIKHNDLVSENCKLESINYDCKAFIPERREINHL